MEITEANYYEDVSHITNSMLGLLKEDPFILYNHIIGNRRDSTEPMKFGTAYHMLVLEPERFIEHYAIVPSGMKIGNYKPFQAFAEQNPGKEFLRESDYDKLMPMRDALMKNEDAMSLINAKYNKYEVISTWEIDGIPCKCKLDIDNPSFIADLKSATECNLDSFKHKALNNYDYDRQASFYSDGNGEKDFYFIVQEKNKPYFSSVLEAGPQFLQGGRIKYKNGLSYYRSQFIDKPFDPSKGITGIL